MNDWPLLRNTALHTQFASNTTPYTADTDAHHRTRAVPYLRSLCDIVSHVHPLSFPRVSITVIVPYSQCAAFADSFRSRTLTTHPSHRTTNTNTHATATD